MRFPSALPGSGPWQTPTLIGRRWKHGNVCSRPVLIGRGLGLTNDIRARYGVLRERTPAGVPRVTSDFGGYGGGVTPVPIPNTEVKPSRADGTWQETAWESRSPPDFA